MRPMGVTRVDSSVRDLGDQGLPDFSASDSEGRVAELDGDGHGSAVGVDVEVAEVSSGCFARLSPTTIVYMSAFVSSLTSVLLGYGKGREPAALDVAGTKILC